MGTFARHWRRRRTPRGLLAIAFLFAAYSSAQNPARIQQTAAMAAGPYRIAGRVVNSSTGEPVRRATVTALGEEDGHVVQSTHTNDEGEFALEHLPAGKYPLSASRRGFRMAFYDEHEEYNSAIVTGPDQDTAHLTFKLMPGGVVHGVVTGDGGDPAENASVILFKRERGSIRGDDAGAIKQIDGAMTDDTGAYEFSNLAAGEYFVAVVAQPWYAVHPPPRRNGGTQESPLDVAYPVTFFDSATNEASATPIELEAGTQQQADISLHAVPALRLQVTVPRKNSGFVQPELRTMVFGNQVSAESGGGFDPAGPGIAEFHGLAPGRYELVQGDPPRISELDATSSQAVDPNAGSPAVTVTGRLLSTGGSVVTGNVGIALDPVSGGGRSSLQSNAHEGEFRFDGVAPGMWTLSAQSQSGTLPVVAVNTGGAMTAGNQVAVKDRAVTMVAVVSSSLSRVRGFARADEKGVSGAMIVLVPKQPSAYRALARRDQSDSDGSFGLRDVAPGKYTVIAIEDGWKLDWTDRETLARFLPSGVTVTVSDQSGGEVRLTEPVPVQ
jgi:Carboxypeptidase regulatory-like domain